MTARAWHQRLQQPPPRVVDAGVAASVAVAMTLIISVAQEDDATRSPDGLAYLLGVTLAMLLLVRRDRPLLVLIGSVGVLFIYYGLGYPAFSPAVPLAAAAYAAAAAGQLVPASAIIAVPVVVGAAWQNLAEGTSLPSVIGTQTLTDAALLAAVLLLGEAVRHRRAWAGEVRGRLERAERDRAIEAARRVEQERLRVARELHDVIAHTIAVINVQAGVAADALDDAPAQTQASLQTIRQQSREAINELKATVALLRADGTEAPRTPAPGLAALDGLVAMASGAGLEVALSVCGTARPLPGSVDLTAYRIVQESLTNVVRHAHASAATVAVRYHPTAVEIRVEDDGDAASDAGHVGYGLIGMRERVAAVGGALRAGPAAGGGFEVHARLPTRDAST